MSAIKQPVSFSLIGDPDKARLAIDGEVVTVGWLSKNWFVMKPSPIKEGEHCLICAPEGSGKKSRWVEVSINCNGVRGPIWLCKNCSKVYVHKARGKKIWEELLKTL